MIIRTKRVPLPNNRRRADFVIARTALPTLRHLAGAIAPPLVKHQKSTINILLESDVIPAQALPLPKAGRDQSDP